jgi:tape measure domain-containing protein
MDIATLGIRVDATDVRGATGELDRLGAAGGRTATSMSAVERATKNLGGIFAGLGLAGFAKDILATNREMETLRASLKSVTGSATVATAAFNSIKDFAKNTPFEISGLTKTFIVLQNMGIKPTQQVMEALTNQASKLGGSQETLTSIAMQLGQAHSKGKLQMEDMNVLMERGVPVMKLLGEVTGKNAAQLAEMSTKGTITTDMIDKLIIKMGEAASGSNAIAMDTLNGKISSLSDAWHDFEDTLMGDTSEGFIKKVVGNWTEWLDFFKDSIAGVGKEFAALEEINNKIVTSKAKISAMSQGGIAGAAWTVAGALTGNTVAGEENRLASYKKQQQDIIKTTHDVVVAKNEEKAATDKLLNSANEEKKVLQESTESKKAHEKAAKAAAKAQEALAKSFADTLSDLNIHNIELSKSAREHKEAELYAKKYTQAMVAQAMALYDIGTALAAKKKLNEDEKAQLDSLIDRYNKATMSARAYYETTLTTTGADGQKTSIPSADKAPIMAQFDKTATAEATKKATDDATASLDAYNKKLDDANTKTSDLGAVTSAIFDGALGGITAMAGAFDAMVASIDANTKKLQENADAKKLNEATVDPVKKAANFEKYAKAEAKLNNDNVKASLTGASQMAGSAANLFDKKSSAAKAFHNIEIGLSVLRLAMDIKEIASSMTKTAVKTAEGASTMFAQSGWLGFAGVAAMLAVMAGLGFASGGGGGASEPPKSNDGTGTVLGDSSAKSESLAKTNDLLKNIHASEYVELRGINAGVNNLSKSILNTVTQLFQGGGLSGVSLTQTDALTGISKSLNTAMAIGTAGLSILVSKIPLIGGIFDKVNSFLFGGKQTQSVVGQGIETWETNLGGVISGGNVAAGEYADIKTHTSGGLFGKSKDSYMTGYQAVGSDMQKALNDVFKNVGTNLLVVAKSLGQGLTDTVKKAIIPAMRVDLMGLTGEDAAKKLNNVIGATMDTMSATIFGKIVGQYQQLGEGMFETAVRIVAEVEIVKDAFAQSGKKLTGDVIGIADAFIQASGGLEEFQKRFEFFIDKFTTDAEKQTRATKTIKGSLKEEFTDAQINKALASRDNYASMVDFRAGKKGKENIAEYALLLEMAPKLDEYFSNKESLANDKTAMNIKLMDLQGNKSGALAKTRELELAAMDKTLRPMQQLIYAQTDLNNANTLAAALLAKRNTQEIQLMNLSGDTAGALAKTRALELAAMDESLWLKQNEIYAQTDLNTANEKAKTDLNAANEAAKVLATSRANLEIKLMEAQGRTAEALAKTRELELAAMDESLRPMQNLIYALTDINTAMDKATSDVTTAMSRLTELSGKLKSTLSSTAIETSASLKADRANANALLKTALIIAKMGGAIDNITGMDKALADVAKPSEQLYTTFTDYARDQAITSNTISDLAGYADAQVSMAQKQLDAINGTTTAIEKTLPEALAVLMGLDAQKKALPQFADGGYHSGGWRVVGENGPELENTGASRIFSNGQSKGLLSTDELVAELQALRAEVRAGQEAIANNTRQTAKILRDVTQDGQSITTSAVVA